VALLAVVAVYAPSAAQAKQATGRTVASAPGWRQIFSTDFNGTSLPSQCVKYSGPYGGGASYWMHDEVNVSGGLLRLGIQRREKGGKPYTSGGVSCYKVAQIYGRYEWRAKIPPGKGIDSYATLWQDGGGGDHRTLVEILGVPGKEIMAVTNAYGSGVADDHIAGRYADGFHTYAIEWTPTAFRLLVDGIQRFSSAHVSTVKKSLQFAVINGDAFSGLPDASTPLPAEFQVDWVRAYAYVAEAPPAAGQVPSVAPTGQVPAGATPKVTSTPTATADAEAAGRSGDPAGSGARRAWGMWAAGALALVLVVGVGRLLLRRNRSSAWPGSP